MLPGAQAVLLTPSALIFHSLCHACFTLMYIFVMLHVPIFSGMQIYYISSVSDDGTDSDCENLGFEKLAKYNPSQRRWKYLTSLAEGATPQEDVISDEDELLEDDYYPGLPFAALFSCCKVSHVLFITPKYFHFDLLTVLIWFLLPTC